MLMVIAIPNSVLALWGWTCDKKEYIDVGKEKTVIDTDISISLGNYLDPFSTGSCLIIQGLIHGPSAWRSLWVYIPRKSNLGWPQGCLLGKWHLGWDFGWDRNDKLASKEVGGGGYWCKGLSKWRTVGKKALSLGKELDLFEEQKCWSKKRMAQDGVRESNRGTRALLRRVY